MTSLPNLFFPTLLTVELVRVALSDRRSSCVDEYANFCPPTLRLVTLLNSVGFSLLFFGEQGRVGLCSP